MKNAHSSPLRKDRSRITTFLRIFHLVAQRRSCCCCCCFCVWSTLLVTEYIVEKQVWILAAAAAAVDRMNCTRCVRSTCSGHYNLAVTKPSSWHDVPLSEKLKAEREEYLMRSYAAAGMYDKVAPGDTPGECVNEKIQFARVILCFCVLRGVTNKTTLLVACCFCSSTSHCVAGTVPGCDWRCNANKKAL